MNLVLSSYYILYNAKDVVANGLDPDQDVRDGVEDILNYKRLCQSVCVCVSVSHTILHHQN